MELEELRALKASDQATFMLGRIASETLRMDIALRFLNASLRGRKDIDAYRQAPQGFRANARECTSMINERGEISGHIRTAMLEAVEQAEKVYDHRNRYMHDHLREAMLQEGWELARVSQPPKGTPEIISVTLDEMIYLVHDTIAATWRLRGGAMHLHRGESSWTDLLLGALEPEWDGSVGWVR